MNVNTVALTSDLARSPTNRGSRSIKSQASAVAGTLALNHVPSTQQFFLGQPPPVLLLGNVARTQFLTVAGLAAMPQRTVTVEFRSGSDVQRHTYAGPRLLDVIAQAGPQFDPAIKNDKLRHYVSVTDNYQALVAYGEIDPNFENKEVLLAVSEDGRSLATDGPRLVVPGDIAGGRYVTNVSRLYFAKPPL